MELNDKHFVFGYVLEKYINVIYELEDFKTNYHLS